MPRKKLGPPGDKVGLRLTAAERNLLVEGLTCLPTEYVRLIQDAPPSDPIVLKLDQLDDLAGYVAAAANHATDKKTQKKLDTVFRKIQRLLGSNADEAPLKAVRAGDGKADKLIAQTSAMIGEWAGQALTTAKQLRIERKVVGDFPLGEVQRGAVSLLKTVPAKLRKKLQDKHAEFTVAELVALTQAVADSLGKGPPLGQFVYLTIGKTLMDCIQGQMIAPETRSKPTDRFFQFKITLKDTDPPIWRRIQVPECTLDELHEHIQTAMGWTTSHLHHFKIGKHLYGDPDLMQENFDDMGYQDSTDTTVSDILPRSGKRFRFEYEYDFGDSWHHEILFEGEVQSEEGKRYPLCLEGERACPPEDVGGVWGYQEFVEAMADPGHERHRELRAWIGGKFDPEAFDAKKATARMKKGLPDWRSERWV